uniref:WD repeat domain, phosphoinositide interacting 1 n=1 Tax=Oncorhynchus kisutch TaxID=8019 RepID=A0A8C7HIV0_ONCKI
SVDKLDCIYESETPDVYIVERLFSSSLVVVVSLSIPRRMNVYHFKKGTEICNYSYSNNILSVRLNRQVTTVTTSSLSDSTDRGQRMFEFRRGMKRSDSLSFSPDAKFLCASSNTETVHIFKLEQHGTQEECPTWGSYVGKMFSAASSYLPAQVSGVMSQERAFATVRLLVAGQRNVCTLATIQKLPRLLVASSDGQLFIYNVDPQDGGECVLAQKHRLFGEDEDKEEGVESEGSEVTVPVQACPSYAATVAIPATGPVTTTLTGYSEDGGAKKGEVIPEHEFAAGPVCLDDENEFPPVSNQQLS